MSFTPAGDLVVHYDLRGPKDAPVVVMANSLGSAPHIWEPLVVLDGAAHIVTRFLQAGDAAA